jgi:hypothetical protein
MNRFVKFAAACCLGGWSVASAAAEHRNATPTAIAADNNRACVFFYISGVASPDPAVPGAEAFAIPRSHPAFGELVAMLLTARAAGLKLGIFTTGTGACGQAEVNLLIIEGG